MPDAPTDPIQEVSINPIQIGKTDSSDFSSDGLVVTHPLQILNGLGYTDLTSILAKLPAVHHGGVQSAPIGVIQDPAGSAIGTRHKPRGSGAAGAIYAKFPDLKEIDPIAPRSSIFNRSIGPGHRVLHTHSPRLAGSPTSASARSKVLEDLSNSYYNAVVAVNRRSGALGEHGKLLNLVPVSASIYAGDFADDQHDPPHLDRSYTLTAIMIAIGEALKTGESLVDLTLHCFSQDAYVDTGKLVSTLKAGGS
jgi:hypothetical protein